MMRLLLLAPFYPDAPSDGDRLRLFHMLRSLGRRHQVTLLCFADPARPADWQPGAIGPSLQAVQRVAWGRAHKGAAVALGYASSQPLNLLAYDSAQMRRRTDALLATGRFDAVLAYRLRMAPYAERTRLPRVLDLCDSLTRYAERRAAASQGLTRRFWSEEATLLAGAESRAAAQFDVCLLNASTDCAALAAMAPGRDLRTASNGVDEACFKVRRAPVDERLFFIGQLGYAPNTDAALWMAREIFPLIRARRPKAELILAGAGAPAAVRALASLPGVSLPGYIADPAAELGRAAIAVVPVRTGAGRQNKLLEALAAGVPVVTTRFAAEGAGVTAGKHALVADDAQGFADAVVALLQAPTKATRLARAGQALARKEFRWEQHAQAVDSALKDALKKGTW